MPFRYMYCSGSKAEETKIEAALGGGQSATFKLYLDNKIIPPSPVGPASSATFAIAAAPLSDTYDLQIFPELNGENTASGTIKVSQDGTLVTTVDASNVSLSQPVTLSTLSNGVVFVVAIHLELT